MSILIKGIDLPKDIDELRLIVNGMSIAIETDSAIQIPTPHGRLIDESERIQKWYEQNDITEEDFGAVFMGYQQIANFIRNAPTILEAEG